MSDETTTTPEKGKAKGDKKKSPLMLIMLLVVGLVGGLGVFKMMSGGSAGAEPPPEAGEIANIEAININLANGHFLRIAVGAQLTKKVPEKAEAWVKVEGAKVSDAMIKVFSGKDIEAVRSTTGREELLQELDKLVLESTEQQVMKIYLAEYVSQ